MTDTISTLVSTLKAQREMFLRQNAEAELDPWSEEYDIIEAINEVLAYNMTAQEYSAYIATTEKTVEAPPVVTAATKALYEDKTSARSITLSGEQLAKLNQLEELHDVDQFTLVEDHSSGIGATLKVHFWLVGSDCVIDLTDHMSW
jgi:hypothetical protein